jgi:hypothetical protein
MDHEYLYVCIMNPTANPRIFIGLNIHVGLNALKTLQRSTRCGGKNKSKHGYCEVLI